MKKYNFLLNCFLLLIPIIAWNLLLYDQLPPPYQEEHFSESIPNIIITGENVFRVGVFGLPLLMKLSIRTKREKQGLLIFSAGLVIYFFSWLSIIYLPEWNWNKTVYGFAAPAYSTIVFLIGISMVGHQSFLPIKRITIIYLALSTLFVGFHTSHAVIAYLNYY